MFPPMKALSFKAFFPASLAALCLTGPPAQPAGAQEASLPAALPPADAPPAAVRLTLEEVKQRVLANSKLLQLAARNVKSKEYATNAVRANYFPQVIGSSVYFHFNDDLGDVVTTGGRTVQGPRGRPLGTLPVATFDIPLIQQDSSFSTITAVQPITDLLKVRAGVAIARADERIAQAQLEKGTRELLSGVEQLYWGLLAAQRIRAGAVVGVQGAELLAKTGNLEARTALVQGKQGLLEVENQIKDLEEQLTILLELPTCTKVELVEPPPPLAPVKCADEAVGLALETSPEVREAQDTVAKAHAAVAAAKVDYLPNVALVGGYANNNLTPVVQPNIGYVGVVGTYTFVDWGKRRNTLRERQELVAMASLKVQQTQDDVRQKALKAFREYEETAKALKLADELAAVRTEAEKAAKEPSAKFTAAKDMATAQVDAVKADLAHRVAFVKLMALIGRP
jgi:outer membrane protein TolC